MVARGVALLRAAGVVAITATAIAAAPAASQTPAAGSATQAAARIGDDVYRAGGRIDLHADNPGDVVAAGGRVDVTGRVGGDVLLAGGRVAVDATVDQDLYAAGGAVRIAGPVGRSARLAGGEVAVAPGAAIAGAVTIAGGHVAFDGHAGRDLLIRARRAEINGRVDGDLLIAGGELSLGPDAVVRGRLEHRVRTPPQVAAGARIAGGIVAAAPEPGRSGGRVGATLVTVAAALLAAAVLLWLVPRAARRAGRSLRARPVAAPLAGVATLVGLPVVAVLALITVVGIPLGLFAGLVLLGLLLTGALVTAVAIGDAIVERRGAGNGWQRWLAAAVVLLGLCLLAQLPYLGWILWPLATVFGAGAVAIAAIAARRGSGGRATERPAP
ncbi:MAG: hypothetical protein AB7G13_22020 [Lautropia sp.]